MSDGTDKDPQAGDPMVEVDRSDIEIIIAGLSEMPNAMTQMAESVKLLAENTNRAPTKSYTTMIVVASMFFGMTINVWVLVWGVSEIRSYQEVAATRGISISKTVDRVADCIDVIGISDGDVPGECAQQLAELQEQNKQDVLMATRCEAERTIVRFAESNPAIFTGVNVPKLTPPCNEYFANRPNS